MSALRESISWLLSGVSQAGTAPHRHSVVGGAVRSRAYEVRRVTHDRRRRLIVERWTETVGGSRR